MVATGTGVEAGVSHIDYEGRLAGLDGQSLPDGTYEVVLKIYSDPTRLSPIWETDGPVPVNLVDGTFAYVLGSQKSLPKPIGEYDMVWVGVALAGGPEVMPRTPLRLKEFPGSGGASLAYNGTPTFPIKATHATYRSGVFPDLYFHGAVAFGLGSISPGESYENFITPWQTGTGISYGLSLVVGLRNIYQFQYTPRLVTSSDLNRFERDSVIPLDYHVRNELVHKVNLLCFRKPEKGRVPVIFVTYGTASTGSVRQVDLVGSGFVDGSSKMLGVEAGLLSKNSSISAYIQRRATTFRSVFIQQIGTFQAETEARFWSFGLQVAFGSGLNF